MTLIVGLGNPGNKYSQTLHNVGFRVLELLARETGAAWHNHSTMSELAKLTEPDDVYLLRPQTFMNESGRSVQEIVNYYKIAPNNVWVVHDDLDIPIGRVRISFAASAAGHKGVQSIIDTLGTNTFWRFRLGIGRPPGQLEAETYVLTKPASEAKFQLVAGIKKTADLLNLALSQGPEIARQKSD
jgi:PTH1 family peptidyl-tRNA hydrolase